MVHNCASTLHVEAECALQAAKKGFRTVVCFESSPVNYDATKAAARDQDVSTLTFLLPCNPEAVELIHDAPNCSLPGLQGSVSWSQRINCPAASLWLLPMTCSSID